MAQRGFYAGGGGLEVLWPTAQAETISGPGSRAVPEALRRVRLHGV